ncbi:MAG TPA: hypothetical protein VFC17_00115 [Candidatus Limnocylindrales bacterium]|nr:hypothetical protein [Candidatus Limnocylindrales bacterium]
MPSSFVETARLNVTVCPATADFASSVAGISSAVAGVRPACVDAARLNVAGELTAADVRRAKVDFRPAEAWRQGTNSE